MYFGVLVRIQLMKILMGYLGVDVILICWLSTNWMWFEMSSAVMVAVCLHKQYLFAT